MLTIYLKPTDRCNLSCDHCFVPPEAKKKSAVLSFDVVKSLVDGLNKSGIDSIHVIWHGGEPLFFGVELIKKYSSYIRESFKGEVKFSVQTNLVIPESELASLVNYCYEFTDLNLGTSYDFQIRKYRNSHDLFVMVWKKNVEKLIREGLFITIVVTVTRLFTVDWFFDFVKEMYSRYGIRGFHLERFTPSGTGFLNREKLYLNHEEFFSTFTEILLRYVSLLREGTLFYLNPFDKMAKNYYLRKGAGCFSGDCMSTMITVNPDGTISSCPDLAFYEEYKFGNILKADLNDLLLCRKRIKCITWQNSFVCPDCELFPICRGGCPHHFSGFDGKSCRKFFSVFVQNVDEILHYVREMERSIRW